MISLVREVSVSEMLTLEVSATSTPANYFQDGHAGIQMSAWHVRHTCRHTVSQRNHKAVGVTCALLSPVNSLFHVRGQTTETAVLPFTGQSCGTVFQPTSVC